jgi:hypothetical protein
MIKIDFQFETRYGKFADALHLPDNHTFTDAEIQAMKQRRVDNWIVLVTAPPVEEPEQDYIEIDGFRYAKVI